MNTHSYGELTVTVKLKQELKQGDSLEKIGMLLNSCFTKSPKWRDFHKKHVSKEYTFSNLIDCESDTLNSISKKDSTCKFKVTSTNFELLNLFETRCWGSDYFYVLDTLITTKESFALIETLQVKNPILMFSKPEGTIEKLTKESSEEEIEKYLNNLSKKTVSSYNFMKNKNLPIELNIFKTVKKQKTAHISYKGVKLLGTTGSFEIKDDDISQEIARYVLTSGFGNKSSLLGAGCVVPLYIRHGKGDRKLK